MEYPPESFAEELEKQSNGRYRIRWSPVRLRWQIEERKTRPTMPDRPISPEDDHGVRERDGFELVFELCPGTKLKCDRCFRWIKATEHKFKTTVCGHCRKEHRAFFWTLNDSLLEHLRKINPDLGGVERSFAEVDRKNLGRDLSLLRDGRNYRESATRADFNYIHEIQSVGFTGRSGRIIHRDKGLR